MPSRGEVFRLKRRLGFAAKGEAEAVVVIQTDSLTAVLPTVLVIALDPAEGAFASWLRPATLRALEESIRLVLDLR